jgi:hypothetical protein
VAVKLDGGASDSRYTPHIAEVGNVEKRRGFGRKYTSLIMKNARKEESRTIWHSLKSNTENYCPAAVNLHDSSAADTAKVTGTRTVCDPALWIVALAHALENDSIRA